MRRSWRVEDKMLVNPVRAGEPSGGGERRTLVAKVMTCWNDANRLAPRRARGRQRAVAALWCRRTVT